MKKKLFYKTILVGLFLFFTINTFSFYWCKVDKMNQTLYSAAKKKKKNTITCLPYKIKNLSKDLDIQDKNEVKKLDSLVKQYVIGGKFIGKLIGLKDNSWNVRTWDFKGEFTEKGEARFDGFKRLLSFFRPKGSNKKSFMLVIFEEYVYQKIDTVIPNEYLALSLNSRFIKNTKDPNKLNDKFLMLNLRFGRGLFTLLMFIRNDILKYLDLYSKEPQNGKKPKLIGKIPRFMLAYHPYYNSNAKAKTIDKLHLVFEVNKKGNLIIAIVNFKKRMMYVKKELNKKQVLELKQALQVETVKAAIIKYKKKMKLLK